MKILSEKIKKTLNYLPFNHSFYKSENNHYERGIIDFIAGSALVRYGLKPQSNALLKYLENRNINKNYLESVCEPVRILVGGNSARNDVQQGLNLEEYYKNQGLEQKVRIDTFFFSRLEKKIKVNVDNHNHYNISSLKELTGLIKDNKYLVDFVDFDGTLSDCCLGRETKVKLKSKFLLWEEESESLNRLLKILDVGVRITYASTMYLGDVFYSCLKLKYHFMWPEKDNNLKIFLESVSKLPTQLVISSFSCLGGMLNAINDSKAEVKLRRPVYY
jgi:hypothetical protein